MSDAPVQPVRFWGRVDRSSGCWEWPVVDSVGYGSAVRFQGRADRAHRVAWQLLHGPIPVGMEVCHHCDNRRCIRPDHLFLGTRADNIQDAARKGRLYWQVRPPQGERHPQARLTQSDVDEIRRLYGTGTVTQTALAARFRVGQTTISAVVTGRNWRHASPDLSTWAPGELVEAYGR